MCIFPSLGRIWCHPLEIESTILNLKTNLGQLLIIDKFLLIIIKKKHTK